MNKFALKATDQKFSIQVSVSNRSLISDKVREWNELRGRNLKETAAYAFSRKQNLTGVQVIDEANEVFVGHLLKALVSQEFVLGGVIYSERQGKTNGTYYMTRFVFFRKEFMKDIPEFAQYRDGFMAELEGFLLNSFWKVRLYRNSLSDEAGNEIPGLPAISLNLEARTPRFGVGGKPELRWKKDAAGNRVGDGPVPFNPQPKFILGIRRGSNDVELIPYTPKV